MTATTALTRARRRFTAPAAGPSTRGLGRFPALDGLRAVAVTAVIGTHAAFSSGRYGPGRVNNVLSHLDIGVAIFFVISGFLISREWLSIDRGTGGMPHLGWYALRRAGRILPMYWLVLVVALVCSPGSAPYSGGDVLRNVFLLQGYSGRPLLDGFTQTWSLGTEVAFYASMPAIAWLIVRVARTRVWVPASALVTAAVLAAGSVGWVWWYHAQPGDTFVSAGYWLPTTLGWFAAGIALAAVDLGVRDPAARWRRVWSTVSRWGDGPGACVVIGLCAFAVATTPVSGLVNDPVPSSAQAVAKNVLYLVTAVALVAPAVLGHGAGYDAALGGSVMRALGRASYSVFLVHLLVLRGVRHVLGLAVFQGGFAASFWLALLISVPLAMAAYRFVERPVIRWTHRRR